MALRTSATAELMEYLDCRIQGSQRTKCPGTISRASVNARINMLRAIANGIHNHNLDVMQVKNIMRDLRNEIDMVDMAINNCIRNARKNLGPNGG